MRRNYVWIYTAILLLPCALSAAAQSSQAAVPSMVKFGGTLTDVNGKPLTGLVGVTFYLYKDQQGGTLLWMETQNVQLDKAGHYSVMLGSTTSYGLSPHVFASGEARWLGVQAQGQEEQPRVMLVSVPYAMKAVDAQTLDGLPASAFALADSPSASAPQSTVSTSKPGKLSTSTTSAANPLTVGGSGTAGRIPLWTTSTNLGNSALFQTGSGSTAKVGLGATAPQSTLDVAGGLIHVGGTTTPSTPVQGAYLGWNALTGGTGETDFINNEGLGGGGFAFMNTPRTGSPRTTLMFVTGGGNVGIGTASPGATVDVIGNVTNTTPVARFFAELNSDIIVGQGNIEGAVNVFRVNSSGEVFADGGYQTGGADFAESIAVKGVRTQYEPGDLLVVDTKGGRRLTLTREAYSTRVAGIYSTKPGVLATTHHMDDPTLAEEVPLAVVGIVPCKASSENGQIVPGDLLVSSHTPGYVMKGRDRKRMLGAVVGKALEALPEGKGTILVLVTLQ